METVAAICGAVAGAIATVLLDEKRQWGQLLTFKSKQTTIEYETITTLCVRAAYSCLQRAGSVFRGQVRDDDPWLSGRASVTSRW